MLTCNEFHLFPILPSEIRIKIWGIALSIPRNVTVDCKRGVRSFSPSEPPALLQVCRESRFESLQIYKTFFRPDSRLKNLYVAFSHDLYKIMGYVDVCTEHNFLKFLGVWQHAYPITGQRWMAGDRILLLGPPSSIFGTGALVTHNLILSQFLIGWFVVHSDIQLTKYQFVTLSIPLKPPWIEWLWYIWWTRKDLS
jgi:hypothetical protein